MTQTSVAPHPGLTSAEADARHRAGEGNRHVSGTSRTYATIVRTNVFSFYNTILFVIGATLLALGRYNDARFRLLDRILAIGELPGRARLGG